MSILGGTCSPCCGAPPECAAIDYTPVAYDEASPNQYLAGSFVASSGGLTVTKVTLDIAGYDPLMATLPPGTYTNYPTCWLYSDSSTQPGSAVATFTGPTSIGAATWEFTHAGYSCSGSTRYWIVLGKNGWWNFYEIPDCNNGLTQCCARAYGYRSTLGGAWNIVGDSAAWTPYNFTIN